MLSFQLSNQVVDEHKAKPVEFGFNGVGLIAYLRSYSRLKEDGTKENWSETVERVVNGVYSIQHDHITDYNLGWHESKAQESAREMFERMFEMKFLPPGRGIWSMGTPVIHEKKLASALYNCAFVSTSDLDKEPTKPFEFLMDQSMLGVGVGFDVDGAGKVTLHEPKESAAFVVPDSREGWVDSVATLLEAHFLPNRKLPLFDYSLVRPAGEPIKTFGGISSGPGPLIRGHDQIRAILANRDGQKLTIRDIADIMNIIGVCVVSGGIRRTAEITLGPIEDGDYLNLKNPTINPQRMADGTGWGWASNNSVYAHPGSDYAAAAKAVGVNGEPGFMWLDNARNYGRMVDKKNRNADPRVKGINPCGEITLESYELCNIVETFPVKHDSLEDYIRTLKYAYLYAKTVTLMPSHWEETSRVQLRNRRIGISMSGIVQAIEKFGIAEYQRWCDEGYKALKAYDETYSEWFCIPRSIKLTTVKPSGTVSLLAGATPGIHYPEAPYYIRRMRINVNQQDILKPLIYAGYKTYPAPENPLYDTIVEFPVAADCSRGVDDVSMMEKFELAAFVQHWWADNAVSVTINFNKREAKEIKHALDLYQWRMKSVSLLPTNDHNYAAPPYEAITKKQYEEMMARLKPLDMTVNSDATVEKYCDGDTCVL